MISKNIYVKQYSAWGKHRLMLYKKGQNIENFGNKVGWGKRGRTLIWYWYVGMNYNSR